MSDNAYATAADYADAMITARRAKNWLFLLLLLMLLIQLTVFFVAGYTDYVLPEAREDVMRLDEEAIATTLPVDGGGAVAEARGVVKTATNRSADALEYVTGLINFLGVALSVVLSVVLLLIVAIMLVGRLIGASRLTSAFVWSIVLIVLLFPWQAFLEPHAFKIPGVLYTWEELTSPTDGAKFPTDDFAFATLKWARYAGFPAVAVILLLVIQIKSNRGIKLALGEGDTDPPPSPELL